MKKILFTLLLFTGYLQAQTYPVNPTKFGKISLNTNGVSTSTSKINTQEADGQINYIDAANLPVSTATQIAIDGKVSDTIRNGINAIAPSENAVYDALQLKENLSNKAIDFTTVNNTLYPTVQATKAYADNLVVGLLNDRGAYDASTNLYPSTGGSGVGGIILKGNIWSITVAGVLGGVNVGIGDWIRALVNSPGQTSTNWAIVEGNFGYVPENVANKSSTLTASTTLYPTNNAVLAGTIQNQNSAGQVANIRITGTLSTGAYSEATPRGGVMLDNPNNGGRIRLFVGSSATLYTQLSSNETGGGKSFLGTRTGIMMQDPTARLHIAAGIANAGFSPLKFSSGPLNTIPEVGAVEFLTDRLYFTKTTGATRETLAYVSDVATKLNLNNPTPTGLLDLSGTVDTSTAASHYFVETATDGKVRPKTLSDVKTEIVTTAAVDAAKPNIALTTSPTFTGVPLAPTAAPGTNTTQIATTAFGFANFAPISGSSNYIQNQNISAQTGNIWISGGIRAGSYNGNFSLNVNNGVTSPFEYYGGTTSLLFSVSNAGKGFFESTVVAKPATVDTELATWAQAKAIRPYKVYSALVNQTGTSAPTVTVLENTLGGTPVFTYVTAGFYFVTLTGAFPSAKTWLSITPSSTTGSYSFFRNTDDVLVIRTQDNGTMPFTDADAKLFNNSIEIRVYNFVLLLLPYSMIRRRKRKINKLK